MPSILFGGRVTFEDGTIVELDNAVRLTLDPTHLESGCKKCGYVPANRIALKSGKLRHEIIQNDDGTLSETANDATETKLLLEMETLNHNVVDKLVDAGYSDAGSLKRMLKIVSPEQTKAREVVLTKPGTTERIRQLVLSKTAGDFFRATNGGGCMNSNDCIVAAQLKSKKKLLPGLIKEKKKVYTHRKLRKAMSKIETSSSKPMTLNHLKDFIRLRNPEVLSKELVGGKPKVQELWKKKYAAKQLTLISLRTLW